jgi:DNA-binding MarR family transcriptional regulator
MEFRHDDGLDCEEMTHFSDPLRRAILGRLLSGPCPVTALAATLAVSQPAVSQALAKLREGGLVRPSRRGKFVDYALDPAAMRRLLDPLDGWRQRLGLYLETAEDAGGTAAPAGAAAVDVVDGRMAQWEAPWTEDDRLTVGILLRLRLIAQLMERTLARLTARRGITVPELRLLGLLESLGPPYEDTASGLSRKALVSRPAVSKLLARAERQGWVLRCPNAEDGRSTLIRLTEPGHRLLRLVMTDQRLHYPLYRMPRARRQAIAGMTRDILRGVTGEVPDADRIRPGARPGS